MRAIAGCCWEWSWCWEGFGRSLFFGMARTGDSSGYRRARTAYSLFFAAERWAKARGGCGRAVGAGRKGGGDLLAAYDTVLQLLQLQPRVRVYWKLMHGWMELQTRGGMDANANATPRVPRLKFSPRNANARPLKAVPPAAQRTRRGSNPGPCRPPRYIPYSQLSCVWHSSRAGSAPRASKASKQDLNGFACAKPIDPFSFISLTRFVPWMTFLHSLPTDVETEAYR